MKNLLTAFQGNHAIQKNIAQTIIDAKADYLLALKGNHKGLCEDVSLWLDTETAAGRLPVHETVDKGHGRCRPSGIDTDRRR